MSLFCLTDDQTVNELIQQGMVEFAKNKGSKGAHLLSSKADLKLREQTGLDLNGKQERGIANPRLNPEEFMQLCDLLQHNLIPTESLKLKRKR